MMMFFCSSGEKKSLMNAGRGEREVPGRRSGRKLFFSTYKPFLIFFAGLAVSALTEKKKMHGHNYQRVAGCFK